MTRVTTIVFGLAVRVGLLRAWGPSSSDLESGHVNTRAEAERRRALALKALDQRVASNKPSVSSSAGRNSASGPGGSGSSVSSPAMGASGSNIGASGSRGAGASADSGDVMFDAAQEASATPLPKD